MSFVQSIYLKRMLRKHRDERRERIEACLFHAGRTGNHEGLDEDVAMEEEVRNAARTLADAVGERRAGRFSIAGSTLEDPRAK